MVDTPLQHFVDIEDCAFGVVNSGGCSPFQEGGPESVFQLPEDHTPWVLERRVRLLVKPRIQEKSMLFLSWPWNTEPALYSHEGTGGNMGVCPSPHAFTVDNLEKTSGCVPQGVLWGCSESMG